MISSLNEYQDNLNTCVIFSTSLIHAVYYTGGL